MDNSEMNDELNIVETLSILWRYRKVIFIGWTFCLILSIYVPIQKPQTVVSMVIAAPYGVSSDELATMINQGVFGGHFEPKKSKSEKLLFISSIWDDPVEGVAGAKQFIKTITNELQPYIDRQKAVIKNAIEKKQAEIDLLAVKLPRSNLNIPRRIQEINIEISSLKIQKELAQNVYIVSPPQAKPKPRDNKMRILMIFGSLLIPIIGAFVTEFFRNNWEEIRGKSHESQIERGKNV